MNRNFCFLCAIVIYALLGSTCWAEEKKSFAADFFSYSWKNNKLDIRNKFRIEGFYSKNARMLNNENNEFDGLDKRFSVPFYYDLKPQHTLYNADHDIERLVIRLGVRFKGVLGAPESNAKTGMATIKDLEVVGGLHKHAISVYVPILRMLEFDISLNELLGFYWEGKHRFSCGIFPFSVGRGISLGDAYATMPELIGYDPAISVDQYAPGFKFTGQFGHGHTLDYDFYVALLDDKADTFDVVNDHVYGQLYGKRWDQARGFGVLNYIVAGRLRFTPFDEVGRTMCIEPYALFDDHREQRVEVVGDAYSRLGTIGIATEATLGAWEFGFDGAFNVGNQYVRGLDRNVVQKELVSVKDGDGNTVDGIIREVYSKVLVGSNTGKKAPYSKNNQKLADVGVAYATETSDLSVYNGKEIVDPATDQRSGFYNAKDRFRNPYVNSFGGSMFVMDASYQFTCPEIKVAIGGGLATGDENPNRDLDDLNDSAVDGTYNGFVGLQELYSGERVRSSFILAGKGRIPRITSYSRWFIQELSDTFPQQISRFNNLMFVGCALWKDFERCNDKWQVNPNLLFFWQNHPTRIPDLKNGNLSERLAHTFLGTELNIYVDGWVMPGLKVFLVSGIFAPGLHFTDIKGLPLSKAERTFLNRRDRTGDDALAERVPVVGDDPAYFIDAGLEYEF
jgi:hypothetical protein